MREILFRGKAVNLNNGSKDFVYGQYVQNRDGKMIYSDTWEDGIQKHYVIEKTVGQYTGLTDKNGKKIFEGDIVKATITSNMEIGDYTKADIGVVGYDNIGVLGIVKYYDNGVPVWSDIILKLALSGAVIDYSFEVIGNIHDNSELLKGDENNG